MFTINLNSIPAFIGGLGFGISFVLLFVVTRLMKKVNKLESQVSSILYKELIEFQRIEDLEKSIISDLEKKR